MLNVYGIESLTVKRDKPFIERDTSTQTEQVGYVTIGQMVTQMMMSGERLMSYKRQLYDFPEGVYDVDEAVPDPTLDVGFDFADASFYQSSIALKLKKARAMQAKREKEEKEGKDTSVPSPSSASDGVVEN